MGEWKDNSAGGAYPPMVDRDEEEKSVNEKIDTNDRWFNNPQYRISVKKKTNFIISLMQEDKKLSKIDYIPVNFLVVRVKNRKERLWELDRDDVVLEAGEGMQRFAQREITCTFSLLPEHDKKPVHYIIVPNTETTKKDEEQRPFFLRVFASEKNVEVVMLPPTIMLQYQGKWDKNTDGGRRILENGREN
jgi:calpain